MAFPYSAGDVLTAADLNASSGLVFIKSQTIGSGVSSVTVTGAFSSTFTNYKIIMAGMDASGSGNDLLMQLGSTTTGYYYTNRNYKWDGSNAYDLGNNTANIKIGVSDSAGNTTFDLTLCKPNVAGRCAFMGQFFGAGYGGWVGGTETSSTQHTAFTLFLSSGTMSNGNIRVYGFNDG